MRASLKLTSFLLALGLLSFAPAYAETVTVKDARRDVVDVATNEPVPAPRERRADLTKFVISHTQSTVTFTFHVAKRFGRAQLLGVAGIKTPSARVVGLVSVSNGEVHGSLDRGERVVDCPGLRSMVVRGTGLRLVVPRSCLGTPEWVQAAGYVELFEQTPVRVFSDNAGQRGLADEHLRLSRRVHAG